MGLELPLSTADPAVRPLADPRGATARPVTGARWATVLLVIGVAALVIPTIRDIAAFSWSTEQGAHGPIVLAIATWLLARQWPAVRAHGVPGPLWIGVPALVAVLLGYMVVKIVGSTVLASAAVYCALVVVLYLLVGVPGLRKAWFPIAYFLFVLPPPGSLVAVATQPLRLEISSLAVSTLGLFGLPVGLSGLTIYIGQYTLEVKAACGGLNSLISLSAIGLFYAYIRHHSKGAILAMMLVVIIFMAVFANFVRVALLVLITYYLGNDVAQGFLHQFAGMVMFGVAVAGTMAVDALLSRFWFDRKTV